MQSVRDGDRSPRKVDDVTRAMSKGVLVNVQAGGCKFFGGWMTLRGQYPRGCVLEYLHPLQEILSGYACVTKGTNRPSPSYFRQ